MRSSLQLRPSLVTNLGKITAVYGWARSAISRTEVRGFSSSDEPRYVLVCNEEVLDCQVNSEEILKTFPRGPYTTARTHQLRHVFEFDFHNRRIAESAELMVKAGTLKAADDHKDLIDPAKFRHRYMACMRKAIETYREKCQTDELKLTTLLNVDDQKSLLYVHVQTLGKRPDGEVKIQIMGAPRSNALAKDSAWVSDREGLWTSREEGVHEVVLRGADGRLYEGLSSNLFVISTDSSGSKTLYTAGEGVLLGTVRGLIVKMCGELGVEVVEAAPTLAQAAAADELLISSTSRWALPVTEVVLPDKTTMRPKSTAVGNAIYELIVKHALDSSVCIA